MNDQTLLYFLYFFKYLSFIICFLFHLFFLFLFDVLCLLILHFHPPLLLGRLKPPRDHIASFTLIHLSSFFFSTHKSSEKNSYSIFLLSFCFPSLPIYFRVVSCDFKNAFSLHEILLILFSPVVFLTFADPGLQGSEEKEPTFCLSNLYFFSHPVLTAFISFHEEKFVEKNMEQISQLELRPCAQAIFLP